MVSLQGRCLRPCIRARSGLAANMAFLWALTFENRVFSHTRLELLTRLTARTAPHRSTRTLCDAAFMSQSSPRFPPGLPTIGRAACVADQLIHRRDIFKREMLALILVPKHAPQFDQILQLRHVVLVPRLLALPLRLDAPVSAELLRAHLALVAILGRVFPDVNVACAGFQWSSRWFSERYTPL